MPQYTYGSSEDPKFKVVKYPKPLQDYIDIPQPEGTRNDSLLAAACQARDCRWSQAETERVLVPCAMRNGLGEREALSAIQSAYTREPREAPGRVPRGNWRPEGAGDGRVYVSKPKPSKPEAPAAKFKIEPDFKMPAPMVEPAAALIEHLYRPGERILFQAAIYDEAKDSKERPSTNPKDIQIWERDALLKVLSKGGFDKIFDIERGLYFNINPLCRTAEGRTKADVAEYRYGLVEFDRIPTAEQYQILNQCGLPLLTKGHSGNNSMHAIVLVDADRDEKLFKERMEVILQFFKNYGMDPKNCDVTRLSRFPGVSRSDFEKGPQLLYELLTPEKTFVEWHTGILTLDSELPNKMIFSELLAYDSSDDPNALIGENRFLCRGMSMILAGPSGIGKSSFAMQMVVCWCIGRDFFGIKAKRPIKALFIQAENDMGDMSETAKGIAVGMKLTPAEIELLDENLDIHHDNTHTAHAFLNVLSQLASQGKRDLILVDPLYTYVGGDLVKPEVIASFCTEGINPIARANGLAVIFMHHVPKPPTDKAHERKGRDRAYAGAGHANLTNWTRAYADLNPIQDTDLFEFNISKREKRAGLLDEHGKAATSIKVQHAAEGIFWERADLGLAPGEVFEEKKAGGGRPVVTFNSSPENLEKIKTAMDAAIAKDPKLSGRRLQVLLSKLAIGKDCYGKARTMGATKCYNEIMPDLQNSGYLVRQDNGFFIFNLSPDSTDLTTDLTDSETPVLDAPMR